MKKIITSNIFYILMIIVLLVVQLYFSIQYRQISVEADKINSEYQALMFENQNLKADISHYGSFSIIEQKAKKNGFINIEKIVYLSSDNKLAQKP